MLLSPFHLGPVHSANALLWTAVVVSLDPVSIACACGSFLHLGWHCNANSTIAMKSLKMVHINNVLSSWRYFKEKNIQSFGYLNKVSVSIQLVTSALDWVGRMANYLLWSGFYIGFHKRAGQFITQCFWKHTFLNSNPWISCWTHVAKKTLPEAQRAHGLTP